ncbi:hypothetical protein MRX96_008140 [Rhipicephalus microplus]
MSSLLFLRVHSSRLASLPLSGSIEGFADLGQFETEGSGKELADRRLVVVFQPFTGKWLQILGIFAAKSNVKANILAKIILECTLLCENRIFGVQGSASSTKSKCIHPVDDTRALHFFF